MKFLRFITDRFKSFFSGNGIARTEETDSGTFQSREKVIAFTVATIIALSLWFIVNLSRDFNITIQVPIQLTNLPSELTISNEIPSTASVNLTGEGWKLITVYSNPPRVLVNAEAQQVNLTEQIRNQVSAFSDLNILQVEPSQLVIETERKATKRVPLVSRVNVSLRDQFGFISDPVVTPDSVTLTGPESALAEISEWETEEVDMSGINRSIETDVRIRSGSQGVSVSPSAAKVSLEIAEFTEAELRVPIRTRNLPSGRAVTYNPSTITVRFDVPLDQFSRVEGTRPFQAFVDYDDLEGDDSGRVTPEIEVIDTDFIVRLRSFQPPRVSYFRVVQD
ncbi:MAG: YbbR-like domain-containing protein [Balneolaceae bacterium]|nr:YbbR-like domain-containing protein [Balneolaceae bacterium]